MEIIENFSTYDWTYAEYIDWNIAVESKENPYLYVLFDNVADPWQLSDTYDTLSNNVQELPIPIKYISSAGYALCITSDTGDGLISGKYSCKCNNKHHSICLDFDKI